MKRVSIILTTYNCVTNLASTLESIEMQNYPNIEVVIKDGNSIDGTVDVINDYIGKSKYDVVFNTSKDDGIYDAMNIGFNMSSGELVLFFNDILTDSEVISVMVRAINENDGCIGVHGDLIYSLNNSVLRYWKMGNKETIRNGWMVAHPTMMVFRDVYNKYGLYDTSFKIAADYDFMIRVFYLGNERMSYIPRVLVKMNYGGTSTSGISSYVDSLREGHRALVKNSVTLPWLVDVRRCIKIIKQYMMARMLFQKGISYIGSGRTNDKKE